MKYILILLLVGCSSITEPDEICGTVYVAGHEPETWLALETSNGIYQIDETLWQQQGNIICLSEDELIKR